MIDPRVIKGVAFGAGCLLGVRSSLFKNLPTNTHIDWLQEIMQHVRLLFVARGYSVTSEQLFILEETAHRVHPDQMKHFFNEIYLIYLRNRSHMHFIWDHFKDKPIDSNNFAAIAASPAVKQFLLACIECVQALENILVTPNKVSEFCVDDLSKNAITEHRFNFLLKEVIKLRMSQGDVPTPGLAMQAKLPIQVRPANFSYN